MALKFHGDVNYIEIELITDFSPIICGAPKQLMCYLLLAIKIILNHTHCALLTYFIHKTAYLGYFRHCLSFWYHSHAGTIRKYQLKFDQDFRPRKNSGFLCSLLQFLFIKCDFFVLIWCCVLFSGGNIVQLLLSPYINHIYIDQCSTITQATFKQT